MNWSPEREVPSLELCQQLKDAGFPQEGIWYWSKWADGSERWELFLAKDCGRDVLAPTVAQMGEWLPNETCSVRRYVGNGSMWAVFDRNKNGAAMNSRTEAEGKAKWLIHLAEQKLINPKELGKDGE